MNGIIGKKVGMTSIFDEAGRNIACTVVEAGPCVVTQVKTEDADGYSALQLGFGDAKEKNTSQPLQGHFKKAGTAPKRFLREERLEAAASASVGDTVTVEAFAEGDMVDVIGTTKGRGFAGTIKRWGFARQATSHGNSKHHRKPGGIGRQYSTHHGVPKNKKMCGHYGVERRTVQNLEIMKIDEERNLVFIRGAVPGHRSSYVVLRKTCKV